jgi:sulfite reductase (NADPH) flavoprotein alpha-component
MPVVDRNKPFYAKIKQRYRLNKVGSTKETWHVVLDLSGSTIQYRPGDSFGIFADNDPYIVEDIINIIGHKASQEIQDPRSHAKISLSDWLTKKANLLTFSTRFVQFLIDIQNDHSKKKALSDLLLEENCDKLKHIIHAHDVREMLKLYCTSSVSLESFCKSLQPLLPRFYSIASSQSVVGDEVHLVVARVRYEVEGRKRLGVCSHFLCDMSELDMPTIPVFVQPTKEFLLPSDVHIPIVMIGPGTGVAPYRAFMQERINQKSSIASNWLFFGERNREYDFFYEEYWTSLVESSHLLLDTAFSRDSEKKVYVQHRLWEKRALFWDWLQKGAIIYVCGDASKMARDVDKILHEIVREQLENNEESAKLYMTKLRKEKRYLRDVY